MKFIKKLFGLPTEPLFVLRTNEGIEQDFDRAVLAEFLEQMKSDDFVKHIRKYAKDIRAYEGVYLKVGSHLRIKIFQNVDYEYRVDATMWIDGNKYDSIRLSRMMGSEINKRNREILLVLTDEENKKIKDQNERTISKYL